MSFTIAAINIYPVKSLAGISLPSSMLHRSGLGYDRQWMVVTTEGKMITQRSHPQMVLVETALDGNQLVLHSFGMDSHRVPVTDAAMQRRQSDVFGTPVEGLDVGDDTADWLSQAIGDSCRLLAFPANNLRECDPSVSNPGDHTFFADAFPLLILSEESLNDLNGRLVDPVTMARFRPNIVVSGCSPFAEDSWQQVNIDGLDCRVVQRCARCSVPTVDPSAGVLAGPEPIHTLSSYRQTDGEIYFGVNATPDAEGMISVGGKLQVVSQAPNGV